MGKKMGFLQGLGIVNVQTARGNERKGNLWVETSFSGGCLFRSGRREILLPLLIWGWLRKGGLSEGGKSGRRRGRIRGTGDLREVYYGAVPLQRGARFKRAVSCRPLFWLCFHQAQLRRGTARGHFFTSFLALENCGSIEANKQG